MLLLQQPRLLLLLPASRHNSITLPPAHSSRLNTRALRPLADDHDAAVVVDAGAVRRGDAAAPRPPQPLPPTTSIGLKYSQLGHGAYGRGAPHVCYGQGLFYSRAHQQDSYHQAQPVRGGLRQRLAAQLSHVLHGGGSDAPGSGRSSSLLVPAAVTASTGGGDATAGAAPSEVASSDKAAADGGGPRWHALVIQGLVLAALLLVAGTLLRHVLRGVVAALVACYSGLPFKA